MLFQTPEKWATIKTGLLGRGLGFAHFRFDAYVSNILRESVYEFLNLRV